MTGPNGTPFALPEPSGYKCSRIIVDGILGFNVDGLPQDTAAQLEQFRLGSAPQLVLYDPVFQEPVILLRAALDKILGIHTQWMSEARPTSTRSPIEIARTVHKPPIL